MRTAASTRTIVLGLVMGVAVTLGAVSASAAPSAANLRIEILVGTGPLSERPPTIPNGRTVTVADQNFVAGFTVLNTGPDVATVKIRIELPSGLRWGADAPDPSEDCTTGETSVCEAALGNELLNNHADWGWNVVADNVGSYTLKVQVVESSTPDPDTSDNASTVTVVVTQPAGGASGGGGGTGSIAVRASAVKVSPAKPKAGSTVVAAVRVSVGGAPVRPTGIACAGTIGSAKLKGAPKAASGSASCLYRTPKSAKGKTLRGTISFSARGTKLAKRFVVKLG